MKTLSRGFLIALTLLLTACSVLQGKPVPAPPLAATVQEVQRSQTSELKKIGMVTVSVRGAPSDAEAAIQQRANAANAGYYQILMISENIIPGLWYSQAILYSR